MFQVPAAVWNQIAETQEIQSPAMKTLFLMDQDEMTAALSQQADALSQSGVPDSVINAYQTMAPLLMEHEAISEFINQTDNSTLRAGLPEVLNAPEAVGIANQDRTLTQSEQQQLLEMLTRLEPATSAAA